MPTTPNHPPTTTLLPKTQTGEVAAKPGLLIGILCAVLATAIFGPLLFWYAEHRDRAMGVAVLAAGSQVGTVVAGGGPVAIASAQAWIGAGRRDRFVHERVAEAARVAGLKGSETSSVGAEEKGVEEETTSVETRDTGIGEETASVETGDTGIGEEEKGIKDDEAAIKVEEVAIKVEEEAIKVLKDDGRAPDEKWDNGAGAKNV